MDDVVFSVGEFVSVFNQTLENAYPKVIIEGEIASANIWRDRLVFFDLKDSEAVVSCMIPLAMLGFPLEEGMQVRIIAKPRLSQKGKFSINVNVVIPVGEGALQRSFELLKKKLESEGLFDEARKRTLPEFPERIAVITAGKSAAWADFKKIVFQRWPNVTLHLYDVQVQGDVAPEQIVTAINSINSSAEVDTIALVRGGGSLEDLQAFNDERVLRAVSSSRTPTITGVGHESDTTLVDYVSDVRASTPTNAAQLIVPDSNQLLQQLDFQKSRLSDRVSSSVSESYSRTLSGLRIIERLGGTNRLREKLLSYKQQLKHDQKNKIAWANDEMGKFKTVLDALNPRDVIQRGYAIARIGSSIADGSNVKLGDTLSIELKKADIISEVTDVKNK